MLQEIGKDGEKENHHDPSTVLNAMTLYEEELVQVEQKCDRALNKYDEKAAKLSSCTLRIVTLDIVMHL